MARNNFKIGQRVLEHYHGRNREGTVIACGKDSTGDIEYYKIRYDRKPWFSWQEQWIYRGYLVEIDSVCE